MVTVKVLFFGVLTEVTGKKEEQFSVGDLDSLVNHLKSKYLLFADYNFVIAVNRSVIKSNVLLNHGDEVAFMPPFAGG